MYTEVPVLVTLYLFYVTGSLMYFPEGADAYDGKNVGMDIRKRLLCHSGATCSF